MLTEQKPAGWIYKNAPVDEDGTVVIYGKRI